MRRCLHAVSACRRRCRHCRLQAPPGAAPAALQSLQQLICAADSNPGQVISLSASPEASSAAAAPVAAAAAAGGGGGSGRRHGGRGGGGAVVRVAGGGGGGAGLFRVPNLLLVPALLHVRRASSRPLQGAGQGRRRVPAAASGAGAPPRLHRCLRRGKALHAATAAACRPAPSSTPSRATPFRCGRRLQPVKETQQKQRLLWRDLLLRYCRHHRVHVVSAEDADDFPLFHNRAINRESRARASSWTGILV